MKRERRTRLIGEAIDMLLDVGSMSVSRAL